MFNCVVGPILLVFFVGIPWLKEFLSNCTGCTIDFVPIVRFLLVQLLCFFSVLKLIFVLGSTGTQIFHPPMIISEIM